MTTQDTVTMIRSAIRALLRVVSEPLATELRGVLKREDDYASAGRPACDWEDKRAREALVDALARDAYAVLARLDGKLLTDDVKEAAALVATVVGQDLEQTENGMFRIAHRVAPDRVISTVDPEARHGHKTEEHGFDGYKGHIAIDPDSEIITAAEVSAANVGDGSVAKELLADVIPLSSAPCAPSEDSPVDAQTTPTVAAFEEPPPPAAAASEPIEVYGDASYGTTEVLEHLEQAGAVANVKVQAATAPDGHFTKDEFQIDLENGTVTCPAGRLVQIRRRTDGSGQASFGIACKSCPLASSCTKNKTGRTIRLHKGDRLVLAARKHQRAPAWRASYKATRPKVERKLGHLMRRRHGGRRARMRGTERIGQDFLMLCAAANLHRLALFELRSVAVSAEAAAAN